MYECEGEPHLVFWPPEEVDDRVERSPGLLSPPPRELTEEVSVRFASGQSHRDINISNPFHKRVEETAEEHELVDPEQVAIRGVDRLGSDNQLVEVPLPDLARDRPRRARIAQGASSEGQATQAGLFAPLYKSECAQVG